MEKQILQIEGLEAQKLLGRLREIKNEVYDIKLKIAPKPDNIYFTREQTAKFFSVSTTTIYLWTKKGLIKSYKLANKVYYLRSELEQALTEIKA